MAKLLFCAISLIAFFIFFSRESIFFYTEIKNSKNTPDIKSLIPCSPQVKLSVALNSFDDILPNDNRRPSGKLINNILYLDLEVRTGNWYPETHEGIPIKVHAFAEVGKS